MRKLVAEAKQFATVIGITAAVVGVLGFIVWWESSLWNECRADHGFFYCLRVLHA